MEKLHALNPFNQNLAVITGPPVVQAHGHSHDESPSFKYSKAANEKIVEDEILEEDIIDLPPQHGPSHGHGHSHGGHGHSHGGHGHSHGGHGHSHGGHGHSHGTFSHRKKNYVCNCLEF